MPDFLARRPWLACAMAIAALTLSLGARWLFDGGLVVALVGYVVACGLILGLGELLRRAHRDLADSEERQRQAIERIGTLEARLAANEQIAADLDERQLADAKLHQSQKMEAVGQLAGGVAHAINNVLQVISANLHLIGKYVPEHEKVVERAASAQGAVKRGSKLANELLAFGRRQALDPRAIDLARYVAGIEATLRTAIGAGIDLETVFDAGLWNTFLDRTQIETALLHLVANARDAMNGSGRVTLEVGNAVLDDAYARRHADANPGEYVMLAVRDTGVGMPAEVVARAFEPFFSAKPAGGGRGLGLSMVHGFVKQSGGHVELTSEVGHGTTVAMYLPRFQKSEASSEPVETAAPPSRLTVLVVDADARMRRGAAAMVRGLSHDVLVAASAKEAMQLLHAHPVDVLITEMALTDVSGEVLAADARAARPDVRIVFVTSGDRTSGVPDGSGAPTWLRKPYDDSALEAAMKAAVH